MSADGPSWREAYTPLLGKALAEVVLMPIACDTPGVVDALDTSVFGFSGATRLAFADGDGLYLTWKQIGPDFQLIPVLDIATEYASGRLNSIMVGHDSDWNNVRGATLERVELLALDDLGETAVTCAAHTFKYEGGVAVVWVSTAFQAQIEAADDLLVGLNALDQRPEQLVLREVIQ